MHGKTSQVTQVWGFPRLENPMTATRYHSLVIDRQSCPDVLEITAWVEDGTVMVCDIGTILTLRRPVSPESAVDFRKVITKFPGTTAAVGV